MPTNKDAGRFDSDKNKKPVFCPPKPKVGIVTPAYNSGSTLKNTLLSILNQSYSNFEVFIINDHSTDDTEKIANDFCKKDKRFHLINLEKSKGAAIARNLAIKYIEKDPSIKYVAFLDSDDLWHKNKLEIQVAFMEKTQSAFSYGDYEIYNVVTEKIYKKRKSPNKMSYFRMLIGCSVGCLTVMYNKDIVGAISIPNLPKRNDYALWCTILKKVRHGLKYPGILAIYERGNNGISSGNKLTLLKYHYFMHRKANQFNPLLAIFFTITNIINYVGNITMREQKQDKKLTLVK